MVNTKIRWAIISLMSMIFMLAAVSAGAGPATHVWRCEMEDDATEEDVEEIAKEWLTAARAIPGGDKLEAYVYFPVAVNAPGEIDFLYVVVAPSFEAWGKFWDAYPDSAAADVDEGTGSKTACPDSALWESIKVETN